MTIFDALIQDLRQTVPSSAPLRVEFVELCAERAVRQLPDDPTVHHHLGTSAPGRCLPCWVSDRPVALTPHPPLAYSPQIR
ncbi:MAG: hypothetical protein ACRDTC_00770 [Pseudonocardiaceae bacterium]